jgi:hypothetical protein
VQTSLRGGLTQPSRFSEDRPEFHEIRTEKVRWPYNCTSPFRSGTGDEIPEGRPHHKLTPMEQSPSWEADSHWLLKEFPAFYGSHRFITVSRRGRQWSLSWARFIPSILSHPHFSGFILILTSHLRLGLSSGHFLQVLRSKFCMYFSSLECALLAPPISLSLTWSP